MKRRKVINEIDLSLLSGGAAKLIVPYMFESRKHILVFRSEIDTLLSN